MIMGEWKEYKLGEIGEIITGKTPSLHNPEDWGNEFLFITPSDYCNYGKYAKDSIRKLSVFGLERLKKKVLPPKSILVTCIGSDMGKVVMNNVMCITNQQINAIVSYKEYDNDFVYYSLLNAYDTLRVLGGDGTAVPIVNKSDFENIVLKMPPLDEQKRIAGVLSSLDDKIDLLHRENATLEALAETLFRHYFIENPNPKWKEMPVSYYGKVICGKTPSKKNAEYYGGVVPFIKIPDMHGKTFVFNSEDALTEKGQASQKEKTLPKGSIMVSCIATVGLVSMNAIEAQTNQQINSVVPNNEQYRYYLYCWFKLMYDELNTMASGGTATLNLNTGDFSRIGIPLPDDDAIIRFHLQVKPLFEKIKSNQQQMQTLTTQRDTLLPYLMSGEMKL